MRPLRRSQSKTLVRPTSEGLGNLPHFFFTEVIVDKPKARVIIMTGERYFFIDKRYLGDT